MRAQEQLLETLWVIATLLAQEHMLMIILDQGYMQLVHLDMLDQETLLGNMLALEITQDHMVDHETIRLLQLSTLDQPQLNLLVQDQ